MGREKEKRKMGRLVMVFNRKANKRNKRADLTGIGDVKTKKWGKSMRNRRFGTNARLRAIFTWD